MIRYHTESSSELAKPQTFQKGDEVYLARGSYQGTIGVFQNLRADPKWADILEPNSQVRSHPVEWLEHALHG